MKTVKNIMQSYVLLSAMWILVACSGSTSGTGAGIPEPDDENYSGYLVKVESDAQLENLVANSVQQNVINVTQGDVVATPTVAEESVGDLASDGAGSDDPNFSQTTLIEEGVDEMDLVKFDGETIYQRYVDASTGMHNVRLLSVNADASTTVINTIDVNVSASESIEGLYLYQSDKGLNLIVISSNYNYGYFDCPPNAACIAIYGGSQESSYKVSRYDVSDTANPVLLGEDTFSGSLNQSRRIDEKLYTVSSLNFVSSYNTTSGASPSDISASDIIPAVVDETSQEQDWFSSTQCYVPEGITTTSFQLHMTVITTTDLNTGTYAANCFVGYSNDFYASTNAMYFTESIWQDNITRIHQFDFSDTGVEYAGSGSVIGYLSGSASSSFKMSEYDGYLRVISSKQNNVGFIEPAFVDTLEGELTITTAEAIAEVEDANHYLTVLQKVAGTKELQIVSRIPNSNDTKQIGKPGEDVYAVRFIKDVAYVVTFFQTDPFYTIDISDPLAPKVRGELEIPGFSSLLFPINDDYVLGVGEENGLKLDVYDVSDLDNPVRADQYLFGQYFYSPALYDHHTISQLYDGAEEKMRLALPAQSYAYDVNEASAGLHLFEVDGTSGAIQAQGSLITENNSSITTEWNSIYDTRSIIDNEFIHYVTPRPVYTSLWDDLGEINVSE